MSKRCNECLFSSNKIVDDERKAEVLEECRKSDRHFICHKASINNQDVCCRGFFDTQKAGQSMRIARGLGLVEEVN